MVWFFILISLVCFNWENIEEFVPGFSEIFFKAPFDRRDCQPHIVLILLSVLCLPILCLSLERPTHRQSAGLLLS